MLSCRRVKKGPRRRPQSAKRQRFMELRERGGAPLALQGRSGFPARRGRIGPAAIRPTGGVTRPASSYRWNGLPNGRKARCLRKVAGHDAGFPGVASESVGRLFVRHSATSRVRVRPTSRLREGQAQARVTSAVRTHLSSQPKLPEAIGRTGSSTMIGVCARNSILSRTRAPVESARVALPISRLCDPVITVSL